ncbi:hypothetical protein OXX69_003108 [Metschnikowia pulcherrima]
MKNNLSPTTIRMIANLFARREEIPQDDLDVIDDADQLKKFRDEEKDVETIKQPIAYIVEDDEVIVDSSLATQVFDH